MTFLNNINLFLYVLLHLTLFLENKKWQTELREHGIWSYNNIKYEMELTFKFLPPRIIRYIFVDILKYINKILPYIYIFLIFSNITQIFQNDLNSYFFNHFQMYSVLILIFYHLLLCLRFRGLYNGGSDMMMMVIGIGLTVNYMCSLNHISINLGSIYIAMNLVTSYLKAGFVKIRNRDWLTGLALAHFLKNTSQINAKNFILSISKNNLFNLITSILSISVLFFELSFPLVFKSNIILYTYFCVFFVFHLSIYFIFGLNRFFWSWMSAWPSLIYTCYLLST